MSDIHKCVAWNVEIALLETEIHKGDPKHGLDGMVPVFKAVFISGVCVCALVYCLLFLYSWNTVMDVFHVLFVGAIKAWEEAAECHDMQDQEASVYHTYTKIVHVILIRQHAGSF